MDYLSWIQGNELPLNSFQIQKILSTFQIKPKISIIIPVWNPPIHILQKTLDSVLNQIYPNWEICIGDGNSNIEIKELLKKYSKAYQDKIKIVFLSENKGIVANTNAALNLVSADFVTFLDHDDTLSPMALIEIVKCINQTPDVDFMYSDEDKIEADNENRSSPHFKPSIFSPDLLRSCNYICHLSVYKKTLLDEVGHLREGFEGSQDYDLILRATEKAKQIKHIRGILYHWRMLPNSTASMQSNKSYSFDSAKKAISEHLQRIGLSGLVQNGFWQGSYRIKYDIKDNPLVSIIIPNKDNPDILKTCIESIIVKSTYKNYEILILENNSSNAELQTLYEQLQRKYSNISIIPFKTEGNFNFSEINNYGAYLAKGEYLLFLNNDTKVLSPDWIQEMLGFAQRDDVGVVGAKLYYPNGTIQHAGVMINLGGTAGHPYCKAPNTALGYVGRLKVPQNLMAVTGACLMTSKKVFNKMGKFDINLALAFNDVEYCVRCHENGLKIVWTPHAELIHFESLTRGYEDTVEKQQRFGREARYMYSKWENVFNKRDPYYY